MASVVNTIKILTVIDCQTLINEYPNASTSESSPTGISLSNLKKTIYMVTSDPDELSGQASDNLEIGAHQGDTITWRATSLSLDTDLQAEFYEFRFRGGDRNLITDPMIVGHDIWMSFVQADKGYLTYDWKFKILSRRGDVLGCFYWDPRITIVG
ncbi:MAG: hypothetical protein F6K14_22000 [Symploca sp. SIO2C1]|nr:hypothetical protein [Symploca sp. SIO2C1]